MPQLTAVDLAMLILATAVSASMIIAILASYLAKQPITDERAKNIAAVTQSLIALLAMWAGTQLEP